MNRFWNNNWQKITILTALVAVILAGFGLYRFGLNLQEEVDRQAAAITALRSEESSLKGDVSQSITTSNEALTRSRTPIVQKVEVEKPLPVASQPTRALSEMIAEWRPKIAYIQCTWRYADSGRVYQEASGSGILAKTKDNETVFMTNRHVVEDPDGYGPSDCQARLPNNPNSYNFTMNDIRVSTDTRYDKAYLILKNPDEKINAANQDFSICREGAGLIGDDIVVLGYPSYGGSDDITATEGIISGHDGDYYTTSAKIEHGNSGGAAILRKSDCYLGIPTGVVRGSLESLGRILDFAKTI